MSSYLAHINIMPLPEVADLAGQTATKELLALGLSGIEDIRIGRHLTIQLYAKTMQEAHKKTETACEQLLANTIGETYDFVIETLD